MFADHYGPRHTVPRDTINQGLLQPQGELYPIETIFNHRIQDQLLEFCTSLYKTISSELLVQGNLSTLNFHKSTGTDGTQTCNLLHRKQVLYGLS